MQKMQNFCFKAKYIFHVIPNVSFLKEMAFRLLES